MDRALVGYVRALRAAGSETSTAEAIDAARAVVLLGFASREDLKAALGVALAKSEADKRIHERVFELYFSQPDSDAPIDRQLALARAAEAADVDAIQLFTQAPLLTRRVMEQMDIAPLESRLLALLDDPSPAAQAQAKALQATRIKLQQEARALVDQRFELYGRPATETFMTDVAVHRPLGRMAPEDMARMKTAVARMASQLAARHARRQRLQRPGALDMRRTLRANAGLGGVPFTLAHKHTRRERPRIVAVCDVSGSMAAQSRFLLLFLYALHGAVSSLRSFAFSSALQDVSAPLETLPFDDAIALILKNLGSGATDYGQVWQDLHAQHSEHIDRHTTLLVLGDGRSNGTPPRLDLFAALAERAKRVLWLCPEPPGRWGTGDSDIPLYRPHCTALTHCASAADLERALDELLAAPH